MRIKVRLAKPDAEKQSITVSSANGWDPCGFAISVVLHVLALSSLSVLSQVSLSSPLQPPEPIPTKRRVLLTFRREPLPNVTPPRITPRSETSTGRQITNAQALIANLRKKQVEQLTWAPPPIVKRQVTPTQDLLEIPLAGVPESSLPAPPVAPSPKAFIAPAIESRIRPKPVLEVPAADAPVLSQTVQTFRSANVLQTLTKAPRPDRELKGADAPPELAGNDPRVSAPVVILNTSPTAAPPMADPSASRAGQISRASQAGSPSLRASEANGLRVPGIGIDRIGERTAPIPGNTEPKLKPTKEVQYQRSLLGGAENSVSIPLRPRIRTVPVEIERIFAGRNVYTMLIPMTNNPEYQGDWSVWFGERTSTGVDGRVMAPLPLVKRAELRAPGTRTDEGRVRAQVVIDASGRVQEVTVLACSNPNLKVRVAEDIKEWEFRPARKSGVPFAADMVLDFVFRCQLASAE